MPGNNTLKTWTHAITMANIARIEQENPSALAEAIACWQEVQRIGSGAQKEQAACEQVKLHIKLGQLEEAVVKGAEYVAGQNYMSIYLDWELAFRRVYGLLLLRLGDGRRIAEHNIARIGELEWWCNGALAA